MYIITYNETTINKVEGFAFTKEYLKFEIEIRNDDKFSKQIYIL